MNAHLYGITDDDQIRTIDTTAGDTAFVASIDISSDSHIGALVSSGSVPEANSLILLSIGMGAAAVAGRRRLGRRWPS